MSRKQRIAGVTAAVLCQPVGTAWHEVVCHGLAGVLAGGRIAYIDVWFWQLWPTFDMHGWTGGYGRCGVTGVRTETGELLGRLAGSMSTLLASIIALVLLRLKAWGPFARAALLAVGVWWIDVLTYTLPTWGIRRSILWGGLYAEPYEAAVALGMPGWLFQSAVVLISCVLCGCWVRSLAGKRSRISRRQHELGPAPTAPDAR